MKYFISVVILATLLIAPGTKAQSRPQILITWSTASYVPLGFVGKPLPSPGSSVRAALVVLDSSVVADISQKEIRWFLDGNEIKSGRGLQLVEFTAPSAAGEFLKLRVQIPDFKGESLAKTIDIPVVRPEAVISTGHPGNDFSEKVLNLKARPFFFNVAEEGFLFFSWKVNRQEPNPSSDPSELIISMPNIRDGYKTQIELRISTESRDASASTLRSLMYKQ